VNIKQSTNGNMTQQTGEHKARSHD